MEWEKSEALTKSEKPTETEVVAEVYISHLKGQESLTAFRQCWPDLSPTPSISSSGFSLDQISGFFLFHANTSAQTQNETQSLPMEKLLLGHFRSKQQPHQISTSKRRASKNNVIISIIQISENSDTSPIHILLADSVAENIGPATKSSTCLPPF